MADDFLQRVDQFNRELTAWVAAGLYVDVGIESGLHQAVFTNPTVAARTFSQRLQAMRDALSVRIGLRQAPEDAIAQEATLTTRYRAALRCLVLSDQNAAVMEAISRPIETERYLNRSIRLALIRTFIIITLACLALAATAYWLAPTVDATYQQLRVEPDASAVWLSAVRAWLPLWATIIGCGVFVLALGWYRSSTPWVQSLSMRLPFARRYSQLMTKARFADQTAILLQHGMPLDQCIAIAADLAGADELKDLSSVSNSRESELAGSSDSSPSLIRWAIDQSEDSAVRARMLQTSATIYRKFAQQQATAWTTAIPTLFAALVCGLFVLIYGATVFAPMIHLLETVTMPSVILRLAGH